MMRFPQESLNAEQMRREAMQRLGRGIVLGLVFLLTLLIAAVAWPIMTGISVP